MNGVIENLKGKLRFCFNRRGLFENNAMLILIIFFVASLIFLQLACSQPADDNSVWDKPFGSPQYLLHATGHGTMDGPRTDDWWFLNPNQPKNGFIELPDGEGGTFTYSIDQALGPFNTPREVCAAAGGKTKDNSIGGFNCKDMVTQPENPNKPAEGPAPSTNQNNPTQNEVINVIPTSHVYPGQYESVNAWVLVVVRSPKGLPKDKLIYNRPGGTNGGTFIGSGIEVYDGETVQVPDGDWEVRVKGPDAEIILESNTVFKLPHKPNPGEENTPAELEGKGFFEILHRLMQGEIFSVQTKNAIAGVKGTKFYIDASDDSVTRVSVYEDTVEVTPTNPFLSRVTLDADQQVEVYPDRVGTVTSASQPEGFTSIGDFSNPGGSNQGSSGQGGCYKDPMTGTITCVDSNGNPINTQSGSKTNQPEPGSWVPKSLDECETYTSEICGTWTMEGNHINAVWNNGAKATLNVEQFDNNAIVITRQDTVGSSAGLTARYEGRPIGNHVEGSVTWNWRGSTWSGTWKADW
jgi:hypothetical protein